MTLPNEYESIDKVVSSGISYCVPNSYTYYVQPYFANVTGNQPTGQGCPGADPGYGAWDY